MNENSKFETNQWFTWSLILYNTYEYETELFL
jgi:hypothetical protein